MLTDDAIGEALERLHAANLSKIYQSIALVVYQKYDIPINRLHSDTTTFSFKGDYDSNDSDTVNIKPGYNKDHRPDCNKMVVGQITNEAGIPLLLKGFDGNTSDVNWNAYALEIMLEIQEESIVA